MGKKLKIAIDCNSNVLGFDKPTISPFEIEYFKLKEGDIITGYEDDLEWDGVVRFDESCSEERQWYLELNLSKEYSVSPERMEGRGEGARSAIPIGEIRGEISVVTKMLADGIDIDIIFKYTRLSRALLNNLKNKLNAKK
jgi:hypothetical protein